MAAPNSNWQPQEHELAQVLELLKESQSSDTSVQRHVQQVLFLKHINRKILF